MEAQHIGPFILGKTLGVGSTGKVKLGIHKDTGQKVAIKIVKKEFLESKPSLRKKIEREIAVMKLIDHPHVLRLFDVFETTSHLFLVLEHIEGGELFDYLVKKGRLEPTEAHRFFRQIVSGLAYCHKQLICHRDLKPENLLLDANNNIKIADFGMASMMKEGILLETSCGSPHYASPEIVMGSRYNGMEAGVWSCGVVLYALLTGKLPFDDENMQRLLGKVRSGIFTMPAHLCADAKDLIWKMLTVDPSKRITIEGIRQHKWFKKYYPGEIVEDDCDTEPPPVEPLSDWATADPEIVRTLRTLGWGTDDSLKDALTTEEPNLEKVFYRLLEKRKKERLTGNVYGAPRDAPAPSVTPPMSSAQQGVPTMEPLCLQSSPRTASVHSRGGSAQVSNQAAAEPSMPPIELGMSTPPPARRSVGPKAQDLVHQTENLSLDGHSSSHPEAAKDGGDRRHSEYDAAQFNSSSQNSSSDRRSLDGNRSGRGLFSGGKPQWMTRSKKEVSSPTSNAEDCHSPPLPSSPKRSWFSSLFGIGNHDNDAGSKEAGIFGLHSNKPIMDVLAEVHRSLAALSIPWHTLSETVLRAELPETPLESPTASARVKMQIELKPMTDQTAHTVLISFSRISGDVARYRSLYDRIQKELQL